MSSSRGNTQDVSGGSSDDDSLDLSPADDPDNWIALMDGTFVPVQD